VVLDIVLTPSCINT